MNLEPSPALYLLEAVGMVTCVVALLRMVAGFRPPADPPLPPVQVRQVEAPPVPEPSSAAPREITARGWSVSGVAQDLPASSRAPALRAVTSSRPERISGPVRKEIER